MAEQPGRNGQTGRGKTAGLGRWMVELLAVAKRAVHVRPGAMVIAPSPAYFARRSGGQVAVMFALSMLAVLPLMGLIFDGGNIYVQRRTAQNAADAAALAGTHALMNPANPASPTNPESTVANAVCQYLTANAFGVVAAGPATDGSGSHARFVGVTGAPTIPAAPITLPTVPDPNDATKTILDCTQTRSNLIPDDAAGVQVDATIGPFPTFIAGFLGRGIANADGAGIARATTTASATVLAAASTSSTMLNASNAPFIICGIDTAISDSTKAVPHTETILAMVGATPKSPAEINPNMIGHKYIIHGKVNTPNADCGVSVAVPPLSGGGWWGLGDEVSNAGITSLPDNLAITPGFAAVSVTARIQGYKGCDSSITNCRMLVPIAVPAPLKTSGGVDGFKCVMWAWFLISPAGATTHWATLLGPDSVPGGTRSFTWTWLNRNASIVTVSGLTQ